MKASDLKEGIWVRVHDQVFSRTSQEYGILRRRGIPDKTMLEAIEAHLKAWLAGKLEPVKVFARGFNQAGTLVAVDVIAEKDTSKGKPKMRYERRKRPLEIKDLVTAAVESNVEGYEELGTVLRVSTTDGSAAWLPFTAPEDAGVEEVIRPEKDGSATLVATDQPGTSGKGGGKKGSKQSS